MKIAGRKTFRKNKIEFPKVIKAATCFIVISKVKGAIVNSSG